jgi:hypothetical protein
MRPKSTIAMVAAATLIPATIYAQSPPPTRAGLFGIRHCTAKSGAVSAAPQLYSRCGARRQHSAGSDDTGAAEHDRCAA